MHQLFALSLRFATTIRYWLLIQLVTLTNRLSPELADWIGEQSGLNDALRACLAESAKREARSEPLSGPPAKS
jgi:hypothetical protein